MKTGTANLPLHTGRCPKWLFKRMVRLSGAITEVIISEYSQDEFLKRLSDPFWFQSFGCVLGFDFHSSGLTTTVTGALKESINPEELGVAVLGGKGKASRKTPSQIAEIGDIFSLSTRSIENLKYSSRMSAKIDNSVLQDGYRLYHHCFIVTEGCRWAVIQQGLNAENQYARRYHWLSEDVNSFVSEPHKAICCDTTGKPLNMVAEEAEGCRKGSVDVVNENPESMLKLLNKKQSILTDFQNNVKKLEMRSSHLIPDMGKRDIETLIKAHEIEPKNYEELVGIKGVGPKTVRALALLSEVVYGESPSWREPARFSFAHGGKDGTPYPVDRDNYDKSIEILKTAVEHAKIGNREKMNALRNLKGFL
jgi:hypothetical protein